MNNGNIELRAEVLAFARLMEQRLREKDADKGTSWQSMTDGVLMVHAVSKCLRLEEALRMEEAMRLTFSACIKHAVDLANYCLMIADVAGALDTEQLSSAEEHF